MLNRAALLLKYKEPAVRWINEVDPGPSGKDVTVEDANSDRPIYLIPDEDAESPDAVRHWLKANYRLLFESELEGWYTDSSLWPPQLSLTLFDSWFAIECHSMLFDTVGGEIVDDET